MFDCNNLLHPFQNDPGVSQSQRVIGDLLSGTEKIDGRSLADLLDYFSKLSKEINYYDQTLNTGDWQPFFNRSIPFLLAAISKYDTEQINEKFIFYQSIFGSNPSRSGLQLCIYFIYYTTFSKINGWYLQVKGSGLAIEGFLETLIRKKLTDILKNFIALSNAASKTYCIPRIDFTKFAGDNNVWGLEIADLYATNMSFKKGITGRCNRMKALYSQFVTLFLSALESVKLLAEPAENDIGESLIPLKDELQKQHTPHLALIFAFIKLFQQMQAELNKKTKDHLDFFYKNVLRLTPHPAKPDKAHIIIELQKVLQDQYMQYPMLKDLKVMDGKDINKSDILFGLDYDIVVNETQVADLRTLYLNNQDVYDITYLEGVYMAPSATKADGLDKDFQSDPKNWYTLGNDLSKYSDPGKTDPKPYPRARLGFILASPVLYLKEGNRNIDIVLACKIDPSCTGNDYPDFLPSDAGLFGDVNTILSETFYYVSEDLITDAVKKGLNTELASKLRGKYLEIPVTNVCNQTSIVKKSDKLVKSGVWNGDFIVEELDNLALYFKIQRPLNISFSGEKEWILPDPLDAQLAEIINFDAPTGEFQLHMNVVLNPDMPAVTFYDKGKLIEDFNSTQPMVKIELNDLIKIDIKDDKTSDCCLEKNNGEVHQNLSLYHFFRNVIMDKDHKAKTKITVTVCGLKNFIVQNDENLMDVNAQIYPFGTRPDINANFYIGSNEIFNKNWTSIQVNHNWKNKPALFEDYYEAYKHMILDPVTFLPTVEGTIFDKNYKASFSILSEGEWFPNGAVVCDNTGVDPNHPLFVAFDPLTSVCPTLTTDFSYAFDMQRPDFAALPGYSKKDISYNLTKLNADTRNCFLRITLCCQNFFHDRYPFILARQMMAFGRLPADLVAGAYYRINPFNAIVVFNDIAGTVGAIQGEMTALKNKAVATKTKTGDTLTDANVAGGSTGAGQPVAVDAQKADNAAHDVVTAANTLQTDVNNLAVNIPFLQFLAPDRRNKLEAVIPNEPWTPIIDKIAIDYTAVAEINDIDLIQLYPYTNTYKPENIQLTPYLFPHFCDEGTLFIGLNKLVPGVNVNILFQMAEATGDSEYEEQEVQWQYLSNNDWKNLREGFEILEDASNGLTTSGIVKISTPGDMTNINTILPANLFWIKASVPQNSRAVSETLQVFTQAVLTTFTNEEGNDRSRLSGPLEAGSISKLLTADASIKKVSQPYDSFDGQVPEETEHYYLRVSELLRHKGRAIQKWDYERLALEQFPQLFKAKCINHSFHTNAHIYTNDFPYSPGYVMLAVIPDLNKLKAGNSFEPRVPVSLLEKIETYLKTCVSPFVRLKAVNPRFEHVDFCLTVRLIHGKDPNYYKEKLKEDLREFLAPWAIGQFDKLSFGQCIQRTDIIRFMESTDYIDFILELRMKHENDPNPPADTASVCPVSPRSILIAGDIDVELDPEVCETWCSDKVVTTGCNTPVLINDYCKQ